MNLKGKTVVITGSSAGIGKEAALQFAEKGSKVVVTYNRGRAEGEKTAEECRKNSEAEALQLDVTKEESIRKFAEAAAKKLGKIDVLVNNAGVTVWNSLEKQTFEDIERQVSTNLSGLIKVTKAFLPHLSNEAVVINISSGAGKQGFAGLATYCATKFGVRGFTQALARELDGIRAVSINPGMTATRMTGNRGVPAEKVAELIVKTAEGGLGENGGDVDAWEYV